MSDTLHYQRDAPPFPRCRSCRREARVPALFSNLGPGLITGAADDDPSGISTYSVAGAAFGYLPLWTALFSFPLMAAVQLMCARLGLVTGLGLAGVIRRRYSRWVLWGACALLVVANVINIAADLGGMAEATMMVTGAPVALMVPVFGVVIVSLLMWSSYRTIARVFKWLTLVLLAYVLTAFVAHVDWRLALRATLMPHVEWSRAFFSVLVAILGTTISPYLFFWQAAQEVEEERAMGRNLAHRRGATRAGAQRLPHRRHHRHVRLERDHVFHHHDDGRHAARARQDEHRHRAGGRRGAASAGRRGRVLAVHAGPDRHRHAGRAGARGIVRVRDRRGRGLARIAGSAAAQAKKFYIVLAVAMALGIALNYAGLNAIKLLFTTAVINGVLAPPLILIVLLLTGDRTVMGDAVNSRPSRSLAGSRSR